MPKARHIPLRRCAACGKNDAKGKFLRVSRSPQGGISLDSNGKATGRGAYVCPQPTCLEIAIRRGRLEHTLRAHLSEEDRSRLLKDLRVALLGPAPEHIPHSRLEQHG